MLHVIAFSDKQKCKIAGEMLLLLDLLDYKL